MKNLFLSIAILFTFSNCGFNTVHSKPESMNASVKNNPNAKSFYDFSLKALDGKEDVSLSRFKGKKVLLVNVASKCGFTPQYGDLQKFHEKYGDKVTVVGVPCNDFGGQEPGSSEDIASFCSKNYGVTFLMLEKVSVKKGSDQHPLYQWLTTKDENGWNEQAPTWNFCKYLISENGELLKFYASGVNPFDDAILNEVSK
jgi:glutathione peroxidase